MGTVSAATQPVNVTLPATPHRSEFRIDRVPSVTIADDGQARLDRRAAVPQVGENAGQPIDAILVGDGAKISDANQS